VTLSPSVYFVAWTAALLAWGGLSYEYYGKWQSQLGELGDKIRSYNAQKGYDQSVQRKELARDLRNPLKNQNLRQFTKNNNITISQYRAELHENIGNPEWHYWSVVLHIIGLVTTFGGITYLAPWGILSAEIYLFIVYGLFAVSITLYAYF
jgi:hypothetical protein